MAGLYWQATRLLAIAFVVSTVACARQDARLQQHKDTLESLGETTATICEAWLDGDVSGTYTRTALDQTYVLVEQERMALAASPEALVDPRGANLSQAGERLSRMIAMLIHEIEGADGTSVRQQLAELPIRASAGQP